MLQNVMYERQPDKSQEKGKASEKEPKKGK